MDITSHLLLIFQIIYIVTAVGTMIVIIYENRNPVKTISWVLLLLFLPLIGLIIFYFFGEDKRKVRLVSNKMYKKLNRHFFAHRIPVKRNVSPIGYEGLTNLAYRLQKSILYTNSSVEFYTDGKSKFDALINDILNAREHIHIEYYIFSDDEAGCRIKDALIRKAREGVEVRLIYDDVGSWQTSKQFFEEMSEQGVQVQPFLEVTFKILTSRVNYRNHRKVVVIDGKIGYVGGMNIADRYLTGLNGGVWRDCHMRIRGEAVAGLQTSFLVDWYYSRKEFLQSDVYYPVTEVVGDNRIQFVTSGPVGPYKNILLCFLQAISTAKHSVFIQTPYFIPNESFLNAIQMAALRGVDVKVMMPSKSDAKYVEIASRSFIHDLLKASVEVYLFHAGFLHSKVIIIDDELTICGSANMDIRSFEYNFEIDAFVYNESTCSKAKALFFADMEQSKLLNQHDWENRSVIKKFFESVMRLFSPLF